MNPALALIAFFFVRTDTSEFESRTALSRDQLHSFFLVALSSLTLDYSWLALNAHANYSASHVAHLSALFAFAFAFVIVTLVLKHIFLWCLFVEWSKSRGHLVDPVSMWLHSLSFFPALKSLLALAIPSSFSYLLGFMQYTVSIIATGRLGAPELGAAGIATMLCNVTGSCVGQVRRFSLILVRS